MGPPSVSWSPTRTSISAAQSTAGTSRFSGFNCLILNWDDLPSTDKLYAEIRPTAATRPPRTPTGRARRRQPLAIGGWSPRRRALIDDTSSDIFLAINDGTADVAEFRTEGEDAADIRVIGTMAAKALGSGVTVTARYRTDVALARRPEHCHFRAAAGRFRRYTGSRTRPTRSP